MLTQSCMGMMSLMGGLMGPSLLLLLSGGLIASVVLLVRLVGNTQDGQKPPERILAERFARGEIDDEEYWERLVVLQSQSRR